MAKYLCPFVRKVIGNITYTCIEKISFILKHIPLDLFSYFLLAQT